MEQSDGPSFSRAAPGHDPRATFEAMLVGYTGALGRFETASKKRDPTATYTALFEGLSWGVAIDDRADRDLVLWNKQDRFEWRTRVHDAEIMGGIRFVPNSVHHDWSDALRIDESGFSFPRTFPTVFFEWVWRAADDAPPPSQKQHPDSERFDKEQMQGRPVRHSLHALSGVFRTLHVLLEPTTFRGDDDADLYVDGEAGIPPES